MPANSQDGLLCSVKANVALEVSRATVAFFLSGLFLYDKQMKIHAEFYSHQIVFYPFALRVPQFCLLAGQPCAQENSTPPSTHDNPILLFLCATKKGESPPHHIVVQDGEGCICLNARITHCSSCLLLCVHTRRLHRPHNLKPVIGEERSFLCANRTVLDWLSALAALIRRKARVHHVARVPELTYPGPGPGMKAKED